ncbi:hypothetical protein [Nonomuraea angiospora]
MPEVEVDFGAGPRRIASSTRVLNLGGDGSSLAPVEGPVDWSQLDKLPACITVEWSGAERGIVDALATHSNIRFLYWSEASGDIDLTTTRLGTVRLDGARLRSVRLPTSVTSLLLRRPPATLEVDAPDSGHRLDLRLFQYGPDVVIPDGLRGISKLWLWVGGTVSARVLAGLSDLEELTITFGDPPGAFTDLDELHALHLLRSLQLDDAYGLDLDELPELPSLCRIELQGTGRKTAAAVRARFEGSGIEVTISGAKSEAWLAAHMDNPFRDWVEDSEAFATAACEAYTRALRAAEVIAPEAPEGREAAERVLRRFVADLNAIESEYGLIDTNYRELAWVVFRNLAERTHVPAQQASQWFDDGRRF